MKSPLLMVGCILVAASFIAPTPARAGGMKGKVVAGKEFQEFFLKTESSGGVQKVDYYWQVENGVLPIQQPALEMDKRVGVALFRKDGKIEAGFLPIHPEIDGALMVPGVVVAPPKTTLKFHNIDPFVHELYSDDLGKLFAPELQSSQQTRQVQFSNPGVYEVGCKMTPHLKGYVVIVAGIVDYKNPGVDGTFLFEDLAPGEYIVKIFFDGQEVGSQEATVEDSEKEKHYADVKVEISPPAKKKEKKKKKPSPEPDEGEEEEPSGKSGGKKEKKKKGKGSEGSD